MLGSGTLYAVRKLRGILDLFRKENEARKLLQELIGGVSSETSKDLQNSVDKKVSTIVSDIRAAQ